MSEQELVSAVVIGAGKPLAASAPDPERLLCWACGRGVSTGSKPRGRSLPELYTSVKETHECVEAASTRLCSKHYKDIHAQLFTIDTAYTKAIADGGDGKATPLQLCLCRDPHHPEVKSRAT